MAAPENSTKIIALPLPLHDFLVELMHRATQQGLIVPDELPYAAALWDRIKNAQTIAAPPKPAPEVEDPRPPLPLAEVVAGRGDASLLD
jgi:hypothetical protein